MHMSILCYYFFLNILVCVSASLMEHDRVVLNQPVKW